MEKPPVEYRWALDADDQPVPITLAQRAWPLIEMLRAAQKMNVDVTWGV